MKRITHDRQSEFENTLKEWHELYTTASPEPFNWAGETYIVQRVVGSSFEMKADGDSVGIQAVDVVLWLYLQFTRKAVIPTECARLLNHVFKKAYLSDFSFDGVHDAIEKRWGAIMRGSLTPDEEARARELLEMAEKRRLSRWRNMRKTVSFLSCARPQLPIAWTWPQQTPSSAAIGTLGRGGGSA